MSPTHHNLTGSRARRASVVELERLLSIGRQAILGADRVALGRRHYLSDGQMKEAVMLAEAEERGCFDGPDAFGLAEARIASGIE